MHVSILASKQIIKSLVKYMDPYSSQGQLRKHILRVFTVIALSVLTSGPAEEAYFDAIYGDRAHSADLWAISGNRFCRYLR